MVLAFLAIPVYYYGYEVEKLFSLTSVHGVDVKL
jgi:hypothetical protein